MRQLRSFSAVCAARSSSAIHWFIVGEELTGNRSFRARRRYLRGNRLGNLIDHFVQHQSLGVLIIEYSICGEKPRAYIQHRFAERDKITRVFRLLLDTSPLGATGFDVEPESMGRRSSWADSLNSSKHLTANTYQEPLALAA